MSSGIFGSGLKETLDLIGPGLQLLLNIKDAAGGSTYIIVALTETGYLISFGRGCPTFRG
jgi:hypothetical protein